MLVLSKHGDDLLDLLDPSEPEEKPVPVPEHLRPRYKNIADFLPTLRADRRKAERSRSPASTASTASTANQQAHASHWQPSSPSVPSLVDPRTRVLDVRAGNLRAELSCNGRWASHWQPSSPSVPSLVDPRSAKLELLQISFSRECAKAAGVEGILLNHMHDVDHVYDPAESDSWTEVILLEHCFAKVRSLATSPFYIGICCSPITRFLGCKRRGRVVYDGHSKRWRSMHLLCGTTGAEAAKLEIALLREFLGQDYCLNIGKGGERRGPKDEVSFVYLCKDLL